MRIVTRQYLIELLDEYYTQQQNFCSFCNQRKCTFYKKTHFFEEELRNRQFNNSNSHVLIWNIYEKKYKYCLFTSSFIKLKCLKN